MRTLKLFILGVFTLLIATAPAHADINALITFDDLSGKQGFIPDGYMGLHWSNLYFQNPSQFDNAGVVGYANGVVSPTNIAYNGFGNDAAFFSFDVTTLTATPFTLTSAFFTATFSSFVDVTGSLAGTDVFTKHIAINDQGPTLATFNWAGIDAVNISTATSASPNGTFDVAIDNIQLGTPAPGSVPEPGAIFLFGAVGAALLPLLRRRFQQS